MITLALIKPEVVQQDLTGSILKEIMKRSTICDLVRVQWGRHFAKLFYEGLAGKPFCDDLCIFMSSSPLYAITLQHHDAVNMWRRHIGATDPRLAAEWTIRGQYGSKTGPIMHNAVHGSDSEDSARREINLISSIIPGFGQAAIQAEARAKNGKLQE